MSKMLKQEDSHRSSNCIFTQPQPRMRCSKLHQSKPTSILSSGSPTHHYSMRPLSPSFSSCSPPPTSQLHVRPKRKTIFQLYFISIPTTIGAEPFTRPPQSNTKHENKRKQKRRARRFFVLHRAQLLIRFNSNKCRMCTKINEN